MQTTKTVMLNKRRAFMQSSLNLHKDPKNTSLIRLVQIKQKSKKEKQHEKHKENWWMNKQGKQRDKNEKEGLQIHEN